MASGRLTSYNVFRSCYTSRFDEFYDRLKDKETRVIERYLHMVKPKGFLDRICIVFDAKRAARYDAARVMLRRREEFKTLSGICENCRGIK